MSDPVPNNRTTQPQVSRDARRHTRRLRLGDAEVVTHGLRRAVLQDLFHYFMTATRPTTFGTLAACFLAFDVFFACLYALVPGCIANLSPPGIVGAFFFSVETLATVGYGDMHPATLYGHVVSSVEIFTGLLSLALLTGIMFARFSRPRARVLFADVAVVRPLDGRRTLVFRAANARQNIIQEASAQLRMLRDEETVEGHRLRRIIDLPLVRSQHPMFVLGWNVMHVIDEASPLRAETSETLRRANASFILTLSGTDETTGQMLMARRAYASDAVLWDHAFIDVLDVLPDGTRRIDYTRFHEAVRLTHPDE